MAATGDDAVGIDDVRAAERTLADAIVRTDFSLSRTLSAMLGAELWLKFENLQFTASFKERGALNKLASLTPEERSRGVIAMSAGNHAQGVAYHARRLGIPATIVMPEDTPAVKIENTRQHGAEVLLHGRSFEEAAHFAKTHGRRHHLVFIHPFDDSLVVAGQGTVALEMLKAVPDLDVLIVPVGGGGLIAGMAVAAKAVAPRVSVVGVEAALYPSMYNALKNANLAVGGDTLAEGMAVQQPGTLTEALIRRHVDDIVLVAEADIERAVNLLITIEKTVVEGAGAAGLAAVLADPRRFAGQKVGLVLSGGNIDTRLLAGVLTRGLARDGRLSQVRLDIPDRPGELARVAEIIGRAGANIVEVQHQRVFTDLPAKGASLDLVVETRDRAHLEATVAALAEHGFSVAVHAPS